MGSVKCCLQIILFYESGVLLMQHFSRVSPNAAITLSTGTPVVKEHAMTVHRKIFFKKTSDSEYQGHGVGREGLLMKEGRKGGVGGSRKQIKPKESFVFNLVNSEHVRWATMCFYLVPYLF